MTEMRWVERLVNDHTVINPQTLWVLQYRRQGMLPPEEWIDVPHVKPEDEKVL